jgi:hypothetical protein
MIYRFLLIIALILFTYYRLAKAENCSDLQTQSIIKKARIITTDVPKHLEGAVIIVRNKDGRESQVSANNFKVVPRKQQFIVTETNKHTERLCKVNGKQKNLLLIGGRRDHKDLDVRVNGNMATVSSEKGLVLDAGYMLQNINDSTIGLGIGIDTNGTLKGLVGVEF